MLLLGGAVLLAAVVFGVVRIFDSDFYKPEVVPSAVHSRKATPSATTGRAAAVSSDRSAEGNRTAREIGYIDLQKQRIQNKLKDPEAARFRNMRVYYAIAPMVCGEVNASNSFGGRTGFQRFVSGGEIQVLEEDMAAGEMDNLWARVCR